MRTVRRIRPKGWAAWWVSGAGVACLAGALLHVAIAIGGPDWYAFFGAPRGLVAMARAGSLRAPLSCIAIAAILGLFSAYAFSAIGIIRRLPLLRAGLALIGAVLVLRGLLFVPILLWRPHLLMSVCDCRVIDTFIVVSSIVCLAIGAGFAVGARGPFWFPEAPVTHDVLAYGRPDQPGSSALSSRLAASSHSLSLRR